MNETGHQQKIPDKYANIVSNGTSVSGFISNTLDIFNKCGFVCKRMPVLGDIANATLIWDKTGSVRQALVNFGVNRR